MVEVQLPAEWHIGDTMLAEERDDRWTFCPSPRPDESFLSWFTRLAKDNCSDARLLYQELRKSPSSRPNNLEEPSPCLEQAETSHSSRAALIEVLAPHVTMSLTDLQSIKLIPASPKGYWDYLNTPLATPRYCPACLECDETPYFRAQWFVKSYLVCPNHKNLLRDTCHHCGHPVEFWNTSWKEGITICPHCRQDLTKDVIGAFIVHDTEIYQEIQQVHEKGIFRSARVDPTYFFRQLWKLVYHESKHPLVKEYLGRDRFIPADILLQAITAGFRCIADDPERLEFPFRCAIDNLKFASYALLKRHEKTHPIPSELQGFIGARPSPSKSYKRQQRPFHHLKPREILAIRASLEGGTRATDLSRQYKVSRATSYNAKNSNTDAFNDSLTKRRRKPRVNG